MPRVSASRKTARASEQERPDVARKRERWKARQASIDPRRLVFLDETRAKTNLAPAIRQAIRAAGAKLFYLPGCSPDLNPIEQVIAKLKHLLRKAAERTKEALWRRIGSLLDQFTP